MPQVLPPAGSDGLPPIASRAFQLVDAGNSVYQSVYIALTEFGAALVRWLGSQAGLDIGQIGQ